MSDSPFSALAMRQYALGDMPSDASDLSQRPSRQSTPRSHLAKHQSSRHHGNVQVVKGLRPRHDQQQVEHRTDVDLKPTAHPIRNPPSFFTWGETPPDPGLYPARDPALYPSHQNRQPASRVELSQESQRQRAILLLPARQAMREQRERQRTRSLDPRSGETKGRPRAESVEVLNLWPQAVASGNSITQQGPSYASYAAWANNLSPYPQPSPSFVSLVVPPLPTTKSCPQPVTEVQQNLEQAATQPARNPLPVPVPPPDICPAPTLSALPVVWGRSQFESALPPVSEPVVSKPVVTHTLSTVSEREKTVVSDSVLAKAQTLSTLSEPETPVVSTSGFAKAPSIVSDSEIRAASALEVRSFVDSPIPPEPASRLEDSPLPPEPREQDADYAPIPLSSISAPPALPDSTCAQSVNNKWLVHSEYTQYLAQTTTKAGPPQLPQEHTYREDDLVLECLLQTSLSKTKHIETENPLEPPLALERTDSASTVKKTYSRMSQRSVLRDMSPLTPSHLRLSVASQPPAPRPAFIEDEVKVPEAAESVLEEGKVYDKCQKKVPSFIESPPSSGSSQSNGPSNSNSQSNSQSYSQSNSKSTVNLISLPSARELYPSSENYPELARLTLLGLVLGPVALFETESAEYYFELLLNFLESQLIQHPVDASGQPMHDFNVLDLQTLTLRSVLKLTEPQLFHCVLILLESILADPSPSAIFSGQQDELDVFTLCFTRLRHIFLVLLYDMERLSAHLSSSPDDQLDPCPEDLHRINTQLQLHYQYTMFLKAFVLQDGPQCQFLTEIFCPPTGLNYLLKAWNLLLKRLKQSSALSQPYTVIMNNIIQVVEGLSYGDILRIGLEQTEHVRMLSGDVIESLLTDSYLCRSLKQKDFLEKVESSMIGKVMGKSDRG